MKLFIQIALILLILTSACQPNKGIIDKREIGRKKPPSVRIAEEYDEKAEKGSKTYKNPERAAKAKEKQSMKQKKAGDKYLRKKQRQRS